MTNLVLKRIDDLALRNRCPCPLNKIVVKPNLFSRACISWLEQYTHNVLSQVRVLAGPPIIFKFFQIFDQNYFRSSFGCFQSSRNI